MRVRTPAWDNGYSVGWAGSPISANPYVLYTQAYADWRAGWHVGNHAYIAAMVDADMYTTY